MTCAHYWPRRASVHSLGSSGCWLWAVLPVGLGHLGWCSCTGGALSGLSTAWLWVGGSSVSTHWASQDPRGSPRPPPPLSPQPKNQSQTHLSPFPQDVLELASSTIKDLKYELAWLCKVSCLPVYSLRATPWHLASACRQPN